MSFALDRAYLALQCSAKVFNDMLARTRQKMYRFGVRDVRMNAAHVCAVRTIRRDDGINDVTFVSHWDQLLKFSNQLKSVSAHRRPKVIATKRGVGERAVKSRRGKRAAENGNKSVKQSLTKLRCR